MSKPVQTMAVIILTFCGITRGENPVTITNQPVKAFTPAETNAQKVVPLPADPEKASLELRTLRGAAQSGTNEERESAKGRLLTHVVPGMNKEHVELWMGKGTREIPASAIGGATNQLVASYYCRLPDRGGTQLMTVHYEKRGESLVVVSVKGPHFPDE